MQVGRSGASCARAIRAFLRSSPQPDIVCNSAATTFSSPA
jgi:hypothetical protein